MTLPIDCSSEDLLKSLVALRSQAQNEASRRLRVEVLLSAVHYQVTKRQMIEPSSLDIQSRSGSSYMGVCASSTRARAHGHSECSFWYGVEDKSINFMAVMRPSKVMGREGIGSVMTALTGELHAKQRRLEEEGRTAYTLATDGDLFRFFRMAKEGQRYTQPAETQCRRGNNYQDPILLLVTVFDDAFIPPGARMISPTTPGDTTEEEYHKDLERMRQMDLRAGVKVYVGVLQKLPIRLNDQEEIKTLRLIQLVIFTAIGMTHKGHSGVGFPSYGMAMYNGNQKVLKNAIRKAALEEIGPVFEEILLEAYGKKLERLFK
ncbi:hypothetical protein PENSOL_c023G01653 [Penicillium solitum]|uniref:Uncharacterized protein n=1 Tax=Penicillium solitum TaxID=60172 RepID=A0A1V6R0H0_9EURO|nr:uncharacterized protein PENSOL_c023G01653 [Penicillium solitum]OQD94959.1 hypothetical protein PENSOL_c023G01653 [Penicillium solitum]